MEGLAKLFTKYAAILFMRSLGLAAFVALIGLKAGPIFVQVVREFGYVLFLGATVVTLVPLIAGLYFGRFALRLNPALLLGGLAGAQTMIAGAAAVQEKSASPIATLGYSYTVAFGHIFLTIWGTVIVALMSGSELPRNFADRIRSLNANLYRMSLPEVSCAKQTIGNQGDIGFALVFAVSRHDPSWAAAGTD